MAKRSKKEGVADPATQAQFVSLATITLQASFQPILSDPKLSPSNRLDRTMLLASLAQEIQLVAPRIPAGLPVLDAVRDFTAYATDAGRHWDDPPKRPIPASWLGLVENENVQAYFSGVMELIDGQWVQLNPEWDDLPYDRSATLRLLVHLREHDAANREDLEEVLHPFGGGDVEDALREPIEEGWVDRVEGKGGPVWSGWAIVPAPCGHRPDRKAARASSRHSRRAPAGSSASPRSAVRQA